MAEMRSQHFGMIDNAFIRICDEKNQEFCRYDMVGKEYENMTALIFGEVYKHNGAWKFNAIGQATKDDDISSLARRFR
jgi:stress response protein SCP2